jgi:hypothetical protein
MALNHVDNAAGFPMPGLSQLIHVIRGDNGPGIAGRFSRLFPGSWALGKQGFYPQPKQAWLGENGDSTDSPHNNIFHLESYLLEL